MKTSRNTLNVFRFHVAVSNVAQLLATFTRKAEIVACLKWVDFKLGEPTIDPYEKDFYTTTRGNLIQRLETDFRLK